MVNTFFNCSSWDLTLQVHCHLLVRSGNYTLHQTSKSKTYGHFEKQLWDMTLIDLCRVSSVGSQALPCPHLLPQATTIIFFSFVISK